MTSEELFVATLTIGLVVCVAASIVTIILAMHAMPIDFHGFSVR